ncbi:hypothetical protein ACHHYP_15191, partial [Achlya hypogyna]
GVTQGPGTEAPAPSSDVATAEPTTNCPTVTVAPVPEDQKSEAPSTQEPAVGDGISTAEPSASSPTTAPTPLATRSNLFQSLDTNANGELSLPEVLTYLKNLQNEALADIKQAATAAEAAVTERYIAKENCLATGFNELYPSSFITSDDELKAVLEWAEVNCGSIVPPSTLAPPPLPLQSKYSAADIVNYVTNTLEASTQFINCTQQGIALYPTNQQFSLDDVQILLYNVRHVCMVTAPTSPPTTFAPNTTIPTTYTPDQTTDSPTPTETTDAPTPADTTISPTPTETTEAPTPTETTEAPTPADTTVSPTPEVTTELPTTSWVSPPTPAPTNYEPSRQELLRDASQALVQIAGLSGSVTLDDATGIVANVESALEANVSTIWFNSESDRSIVLGYLGSYFTALDSCLGIGFAVFGQKSTVAPKNLAPLVSWVNTTCMSATTASFGSYDKNLDGFVSEAEVDEVIVAARDAALAQVGTSKTQFFAIRETYDQTLQCAAEAFGAIAKRPDHLLGAEEFVGFEAYMAQNCVKVTPDTDVSGAPTAVQLGANSSYATALAVFSANERRDLALALSLNALKTQVIEDHYLLLKSCYADAWTTVGPSPYAALLANVTSCMVAASTGVPEDLLVLPKPDFVALVKQAFQDRIDALKAANAAKRAEIAANEALINAINNCIASSVDQVANGLDRIPQRELPHAKELTYDCYTSAAP